MRVWARFLLQFSLIAALLLPCSLAPAANQRLAVLELRGAFPTEVRRTWSDQLRSGALDALRGTDHELMTQENLAVVAREMGLDLACAEAGAECEVDLGRNIGAAWVVSGTVAKLGETLVATVRLHETARGAVLASRDARGADEVSLLDELRATGRELVQEGLGLRRDGGSIREQASRLDLPTREDVVVRFESAPPGAVVQLDGRLLCREAPCSKAVAPGRHAVAMQLERHFDVEKSIDLQSGATVRMDLAPTFGRLRVQTQPPGLSVEVDGKPRGTAPLDLELDPGTVEVVLADRCFLRDGDRVSIAAGAQERLVLTARGRRAGIDVSARDERGDALAADVRVDGRSVGRTPGAFEVDLCASKLELVAPGHEPWTGELDLSEGEVARIGATLRGGPVAERDRTTRRPEVGPPSVGDEGIPVVGPGDTLEAQVAEMRRLPGLSGKTKSASKELKRRTAGFAAFQADLDAALGPAKGIERVDLHVLGADAYLQFARWLHEAECPTKLDKDQCSIYRFGLQDRAHPLVDKAAAHYEDALDGAQALGRCPASLGVLRDGLQHRSPEEYPPTKELIPIWGEWPDTGRDVALEDPELWDALVRGCFSRAADLVRGWRTTARTKGLSDRQTSELDLADAVISRGLGDLDGAAARYDQLGGFQGPPRIALNYAVLLGHYQDQPERGEKLLVRALRRWRNSGTKDWATQVARSLGDLAGRRHQEAAKKAELDAQIEELGRKAKLAATAIAANIEAARGLFERHRGVEQDPSWAEVFEMQVEACTFAIESEDYLFMQEQAKYLDEFMEQWFSHALERDASEWHAVRQQL